jgi:hypothetical protein
MAPRMPRLASAALAFVLALLTAGSLQAQNLEPPGLLRFGVYGQGTFLDARFANATDTGSASADVGGFGLSLGYDWRMDRVLVGLEADATLVNEGIRAGDDRVALDYVSTFRGRLGVFATPNLLLYGTGGFALLNAAYEPGTGRSRADFLTGWVAGGGVEYDWNGILWFAEYLHMDFGDDQLNSGSTARLDLQTSADVARLGAKFKIGFDY